MPLRNRLCLGDAPQVGSLTYNQSGRDPRGGTLKRPPFTGDDAYPDCHAAHRRYLDTVGDYVLENRGGQFGNLPGADADFDFLHPQLLRVADELKNFGANQKYYPDQYETLTNYLGSVRFAMLISGNNAGPNRGYAATPFSATPTFLRNPGVGVVEFVRAGGGLFVFHGFPVQGRGLVPYTPSSYSLIGVGRNYSNVPIVMNSVFNWTPGSNMSDGVSCFNPTFVAATRADELQGSFQFALYYQRPEQSISIGGSHIITQGATVSATMAANRYGLLAIEGGQCQSLAPLPALRETIGSTSDPPSVLTNYTFQGPSFHAVIVEQIGAGRVVHWASPAICTGTLLTRAFMWCVRLLP